MTVVSGHRGRPFSAKNHNGGREAVQEVLAPDRPELAGTEKARCRYFTEELGHQPGVVIGGGKKARAPGVARKQQRRRWSPAGQNNDLALQGFPQVFVSRLGVADVELYGLAHVDLV